MLFRSAENVRAQPPACGVAGFSPEGRVAAEAGGGGDKRGPRVCTEGLSCRARPKRIAPVRRPPGFGAHCPSPDPRAAPSPGLARSGWDWARFRGRRTAASPPPAFSEPLRAFCLWKRTHTSTCCSAPRMFFPPPGMALRSGSSAPRSPRPLSAPRGWTRRPSPAPGSGWPIPGVEPCDPARASGLTQASSGLPLVS